MIQLRNPAGHENPATPILLATTLAAPADDFFESKIRPVRAEKHIATGFLATPSEIGPVVAQGFTYG